jgi:hypothetical protein
LPAKGCLQPLKAQNRRSGVTLILGKIEKDSTLKRLQDWRTKRRCDW